MPSKSVAFLALLAGSAVAQVSLFIPGLDPQPLSADVIGVDDKGHTTYAVHQGILTDPSDGGLPGTATLVEGSDYASFTYVPPGGVFTLGLECSLSGNVAACSGKDENGAPVTETETASLLPVQIGSTASLSAPAAATTTPADASPSGMITVTSNSGSQAATTSKQTSSAPSPTSNSASSIAHVGVPGLVFSILAIFGACQL